MGTLRDKVIKLLGGYTKHEIHVLLYGLRMLGREAKEGLEPERQKWILTILAERVYQIAPIWSWKE